MRTRPTRREFLHAAMIGAAGIGPRAVGSQGATARGVPVRFVGDAFERGHYWFLPDPAKLHVDRREKRGVVIVGAGIAGCVAAWRLLSASVDDFVVLELEDVAGGLARSGAMGATTVAFGGMTIGVPGPGTAAAVRRLLEESGVASARAIPFSPAVWEAGAWKDWDVRAASLPESRHAALAMDRLSVREWLAGSVAGADAGRFAERWCLIRFGARPSDVSAAAFAADVDRRLGGGGTLVVPGGLSRLLAPLVERIGERLLPARVAVFAGADGAGAIVRAVNAEDAVVTDYETRAVVLAVPPFIASRIAPALRSRQPPELPATTPWLVTAVMVSKWPARFDAAVAFRQCADERASLIAHFGEPPEGVLVHHRPFPGGATAPARMFLRDLDREAARDWALRELAPVFPDLDSVAVRLEVRRIGHGSTRPVPGFATEVAPRLREPLPPIYPCGADYTGLPCAESAIEDGVRGAEDLLKALGRLDESWL
jgi:hypothetical protein